MTDTKHTPTPWWIREVENSDSSIGIAVMGKNLHVIADDEPYYPRAISRANAAHIVKCVNMHDELVAALKEAIVYVPFHHGPIYTKGHKALKKAGAL